MSSPAAASVAGPSILGTTEGAGEDDAQPVTDLVSDAVTSASEQLAQEVARRAAVQSVALLVLVTAMALGIGWYAARRALAPVHAMTALAIEPGPGGGLTVELLWPHVPEEVGGATPTDTDRPDGVGDDDRAAPSGAALIVMCARGGS